MKQHTHSLAPPTRREADVARVARQHLTQGMSRNQPVLVRFSGDDQEPVVPLPGPAVSLLMDVLDAMAAGKAVMAFSEAAELTTVQAARVLHVSRPFLIKLLDAGRLPFRKVGAHRRIRLDDLLDYKAGIDRERESILDQLATEAQDHDMGYARP